MAMLLENVLRLIQQFIHSYFKEDASNRENYLNCSTEVLPFLLHEMKDKVVHEYNKAAIILVVVHYYLEYKHMRLNRDLNKSKVCKLMNAKDSTVSRWIKNWIFHRTEVKVSCAQGKFLVYKLLSRKISELKNPTILPQLPL